MQNVKFCGTHHLDVNESTSIRKSDNFISDLDVKLIFLFFEEKMKFS